MSKYVKTAQPMPTPSLTNQENLQHLDLRPMIAATQTEVQYVFYDETRSPFFNLHMRHELSPRSNSSASSCCHNNGTFIRDIGV